MTTVCIFIFRAMNQSFATSGPHAVTSVLDLQHVHQAVVTPITELGVEGGGVNVCRQHAIG